MTTEHRRGEPGARYTTTIDGERVRLLADADGVIAIGTERERRAADGFGLRVTSLSKAPAPSKTPAQEAPDGR